VLRKWHERWQGEDDLTDRIIAARHLEACGRHFTALLQHGDRPVAGASTILDGDVLTASVSYRDLSFGRKPTGTRTIDALFELAAERGFAAFDLGGGQEYKQRWAPACGTRSSFVIAPDPVYYSSLAFNRVARLRLLAKHQ
jgi:CelD/BcsL family acetyltransferase involved in cellulose biosynthesis